MKNAQEMQPEKLKILEFGAINTLFFGPYLSGNFVKHCLAFVSILHQALFCSNTTTLYLLGPKMADLMER